MRAFGTANGCNKIVLWSVVHGVLDHAASLMYGKSRFLSWSVPLSIHCRSRVRGHMTSWERSVGMNLEWQTGTKTMTVLIYWPDPGSNREPSVSSSSAQWYTTADALTIPPPGPWYSGKTNREWRGAGTIDEGRIMERDRVMYNAEQSLRHHGPKKLW